MPKRLFFIFLFSSIICGGVLAGEAVDYRISIDQMDRGSGEKIPVYSATTLVKNGTSASAFLSGISLDIEVLSIDSLSVGFNVQIVTLGPKTNTQAKNYKSEFGLPATIDSIEVKPEAFYSVTLVPESTVTVDDHACNYDHNKSDAYTTFPSANFDLQFLKSSLANYHASSIKALFEGEFRAFRDRFHFNLTSKPIVYCFPCPVNSVIWDYRFGTAIDPTRNNCYTLYHSDVNTADPFVLIREAILRSYGYAPQFLTDGWAGYLTLALHRMKEFKSEKKNIHIADLLMTNKYLAADPQIAEASAATLVRYLIDQYSITTFRNLYESADDINLKKQIELIYKKPLENLEQEWLTYVDTTNIPTLAYKLFSRRAEQMFDYPLMLEYTKVFAERAANHSDSVESLTQLARAYYFVGDYYAAVETQKKLSALEPVNWQYEFGLATFRMMNGEYEQAYKDLQAIDSSSDNDGIIKFNLALNCLERGDSAQARDILEKMVGNGNNPQVSGETRTLLGYLLRSDKNGEIQLRAKDNFTIAISYFNQQIQTNPAVPSPYMWSGIALLGMDDAENAYHELQQALFLESRPFYLGMINLWLGKAADMRKKRDLAKSYYSQVMTGESAAYHQKEARYYMEHPYKQ